jgi:general secretion pathway protein D
MKNFRLLVLCASLSVFIAGVAFAQEHADRNQQTITPNYKDADLTSIIEAVSAITGKNFIIDPRVRAQVTMLSSTPMSPAAFYEAFLAILQVHGFVAVPAGKVIKIVPDANARQMPANDLPEEVSSSSDEIVTQVISVQNVSAAQLVPILRPLIPQYGHLAAYPTSNILIISDHANNVNRMIRIIRRIDLNGDEDIEVIPLEHATAVEVVRVVNTLIPPGGPEAGANIKLVADERTNSVLVSGEKSQRLRLRALVAHLDTPLESGGDTQVRYLRYADAEKLAPKLKEQVSATVAVSGAPAQGAAQVEKNVTIWADPQNNALIVTAPPKIMHSLMQVIDKLDIRRAQVLVEAMIAEISTDKSAELGINWLVGPANPKSGSTIPIGIFNQAVGGTTLGQLAAGALAVANGQNSTSVTDPTSGRITTTTTNNTSAAAQAASALPSGATIGGGRIGNSGTNFLVLLRAIRGDSNSNVLSTPTAITLDNQEAELKVAQEVPFLTGQYASTGVGTGASGVVNPFQTIQRQEVGTILKVTPQINEGDAVRLKISIESSSLAQSSQGAVDLITNKRTINTNVMVEDGGIVVLGGLTSDQSLKGEQRVPFLGRIPLIGLLFKTRNAQANKTTLMVFIRPKILRDGVQTAIETNSKYNYMLDEEHKMDKRELLPLLPNLTKPKLPPAPPLPAPENAPTAAPGAAPPSPPGPRQPPQSAAPPPPQIKEPAPSPPPQGAAPVAPQN